MVELIITEKPNAAKKIAEALADGKALKQNFQGVPFYKISHGKKDIVVGCAVGHLYTVAEKEKSFKYPVFDLEWKPTSEVDVKSYTKKYLNTLKKLAKDANEFTVATDYDIEGEVIGLNCIRYACKQDDASRMKFSTLTKPDLVKSYENKSPSLDWGQANAGETRHFLDWMYGINLSRALTLAIKKGGIFKILSSGRVQGPSLKLVVDKEKEIRAFVSKKFWQLQLLGDLNKKNIEAYHESDKFWEEKEAKKILDKVKGKNGKVKKIDKTQFSQSPPHPFDLTTLQTEAYRCFKISPKDTLSIAQELYVNGYISYPRTSSQKLPKEIDYRNIFNDLKKQKMYSELAEKLIDSKKILIPREGKKVDPAHPAIYPTGIAPKLSDRESKIYDLIVKRFISCFSDDALKETVVITIDVESENFIAKGTRTINRGWHIFYLPYVKSEEIELPNCKESDTVWVKEINKLEKETQPPKRYTPASIIRELEKQNLGTKATRASIIDSLYERNYIKHEAIEATELGIQTVETLHKFAPEILDEKLTRHFEVGMEKIRQKKLTEEKVINAAKSTLTKILEHFKQNEKKIGEELSESHKESQSIENTIGKCPNCGTGTLKITYSKKTKKKFIACDKYPECKTIFNIPSYGFVRNTEKICEQCQHPMIAIIAGRRRQEVCINPACPSKKVTDKAINKEIKNIESGKVETICPKCKEGKVVVRSSIYGQFLACNRYPKCRYTASLGKEDNKTKKK